MNIGINGYEAVVPRFGFDKKTGLPNRVGSSEFCYQLLLNISKLEKGNFTVFLPTNPSSDMPPEANNWKYEIFTARRLWTMFALSKRLSSFKNLDVFFSPTHYLPLRMKIPSVISILDVSYLLFPSLFKKKDLYQLKLWGKYSVKKAKAIITISESSKNDIIKAYGIDEAKIKVVYPGIKQVLNVKYMKNEELQKFGIKGEYILFVGTLQPRKNITRLIEAFSKLKNNNLELIIVGKKGWQFEEILSAPKKYNVEEKVKFLDNITDEDLPSLYKNALFFILPSLYEGFGLPVLEAMQHGCPVITSNVSSLPEAGGNAALYVNPEDTEDIKDKMEMLVKDEKLRKELIEKGYEQTKKFSWEKTAKETLEVLEEVGKI